MATKTLTTNEIALQVEDKTGIKRNLVKSVLAALTEVAQDEIADGNDFAVPGLVKIRFGHRKAVKKGTLVRNPFTGEEQKSEGKPARLVVKAVPLAKAKGAVPGLTTKAGKSVAERLTKK